MQGLSDLCSFKRDENNVQEASHYGFITLNIKIIEYCTSNEKEEKMSISSKNWMEAGNKRGGYLCPFTRIENRLDNATLDVSSHKERKYFKHTRIQGMPDFYYMKIIKKMWTNNSLSLMRKGRRKGSCVKCLVGKEEGKVYSFPIFEV